MSYLTLSTPPASHWQPAADWQRTLPARAVGGGSGQASTTRTPLSADLLAGVPLLQDLEPEMQRLVLQRAVVRRVARGAMVFEQGSRESGLFVLLKGQAQVVRRNQRGRMLVVDQLRPGDHFGELSAIDGEPQYASVRCMVPGEVLVLGRADFLALVHESPRLLSALLKVTVARVRRKNRRIALLALHDVRGCVVQQLLDLAELQDGEPVVRGRICRQSIADMIGASRAMVSRVMMALGRSGEIVERPDGSTLVRCEPQGAPRRATRRRKTPPTAAA